MPFCGLWLAACLHRNQSRSYLNHLVYRTVILFAVLCVLKIRFVSRREGLRPTVYGNRVLREILVHNGRSDGE
jgi:hypothetical protein